MNKELTFHEETEQIPRHLRMKSRTRLEGEDDLDKEEKAILKKLKEKVTSRAHKLWMINIKT